MTRLLALHDAAFGLLDRAAGHWMIPSLARLTFAGVLLIYFWASAVTKLGDGALGFLFLDAGAYAQMFPKQFEAVGYDPSALGLDYKLVALLGTWAEFVLPLLIVIGLFTRLAAIGMIGFVIVQSVTDIYGHGADAATIGAWFDRPSGSLIMDQRGLWMFLLIVLVVRGGGPLSADALLRRQSRAASKI